MNQLSILIGKKLKAKRLEFGYSQGKNWGNVRRFNFSTDSKNMKKVVII